MPQALHDRIAPLYDERLGQVVMAAMANWPNGANPTPVALNPQVGAAPQFGALMSDVRVIVLHATEGWPRRARASEDYLPKYTVPGTADPGQGPQLHIAGDGTVFRMIDLPRVTWHSRYVNAWSLGIETGNLIHKAD